MLNVYYGQGKADPELMANAWHVFLEPYSYRLVEKAVLNFVMDDKRESQYFPGVGQILASIKEEENLGNAIGGRLKHGDSYEELSERAKRAITKELYNKLSDKREYLYDDDNMKTFISWFNERQMQIEGGANE